MWQKRPARSASIERAALPDIVVVFLNIEKYNVFIDEQKDYFHQNLQPNFKWNWSDSSWSGGTIGSGWLLSRSGKIHFTFGTIKKLKGIENNIIEPIFWKYGGRPHWGKVHSLGADELTKLYPKFGDFQALRQKLDPTGRMLNDHLRILFGVTS